MVKRVPDISKIKETIGWQATRGVRQIIEDVVEYERRAQAAQDLPAAEGEASLVGVNGRQASFIPV